MKFSVNQKVRINAKGVNAHYGIIKEQYFDLPCYFVKVGCKEDRVQNWIVNDQPSTSCILLGADYLTAID